nr:hypothetical protein [Tanacetum cinerariifolium]
YGTSSDPETADPYTIDKWYESVSIEQEVACLMLLSMSPDIQRTLEKFSAYDMLKELKTMFEEHAKQELFETFKPFHASKQEDDIPKKAEAPALLAIRDRRIQKDKKKLQGAKGKDKGKNKLIYAPKPKILLPPKRDNPTKESICHHCKEVDHRRRNCPSYQAKLRKKKNATGLVLQMVAAAQNTNNSTIRSILHAKKLIGFNFTNCHRNMRNVLKYEKKLKFVEQPMAPAPILKLLTHTLLTSGMSRAYDMLKELKTMFEEHAKQELFETFKPFHDSKQEDGQSVSSYLLKMKSYLDTLERLGYVMPNELGKDKKKLQGAKGKDKGKNKLVFAPKPKILLPPKRDNPTKESICHHCKEVDHRKRNCPSYQAKLRKKKNANGACTSGIFTIKFYAFPNKPWKYDTACETYICNTSHGLMKAGG